LVVGNYGKPIQTNGIFVKMGGDSLVFWECSRQ